MKPPSTPLRLCHSQALIALMEQAFPGTNGCTVAFTFRIPAGVGPDAVARALDRYVEVQEAMRLRLVGDGQTLVAHEPVAVPVTDLRGAPGGWRPFAAAEVARPLPLSGPLFAFALAWTDEGLVLVARIHHLISDNGSFRVLCRSLYGALVKGVEPAPPRKRYTEFLAGEEAYGRSPEAEVDRAWWNERFAMPPEPASLTGTVKPSAVPTAENMTLRLPEELRAKLKAFCAEEKVSHFRVVLALIAAYLGRVSGEEDVVIGVPVHGRPEGFSDTAGMFVNPLPVRLNAAEGQTFSEAVADASAQLKLSLSRGRYPYGRLISELGRDTLYRYSVVQSSPTSDDATRALEPEFWPVHASPEHLAFCLNPDTPDSEGLTSVRCEYRTELFTGPEVRRLMERFAVMLDAALDDPRVPLSSLPVATAAERVTVVEGFNAGRAPAPTVPTYLALWNAQVHASPDRTALVAGERSFTYRQVDARVRALSARLRDLGVGRDVVVPILVERSPEFVFAALAALRAGGGYLPIDSGYPAPRVKFMLEDTGAKLVLRSPSLDGLLEGFAGERLDLTDQKLYEGTPAAEWPGGAGTDLAYVIYTSGSTGTPKGVMIEQQNLVSFVEWQRAYYEMDGSDAQAHYYSFSFDAAVGSLFTPLACGASLHVLPEEIRLSIEGLNAYFEKHRITFADLPTQLAEQFMEWAENRSLRYLLTGGDRLKTFRPRRYTLVNEYGPTECTVSATQFVVKRASESIPIGRPLGGVWAYVLDRKLRPTPMGIAGELCLAGYQVARGYLNRPELTSEKFVANPFALGPANDRIYRTGDLVRWLEDGTLEFLGRIDQQVKIRGFRIELGEVEQRLAEAPGVTAAAVIAADDASGTKQLYAYVTVAPGTGLAELNVHLAQTLPAYMLPRQIVMLAAMPYSTSGKIDRKALPKPQEEVEDHELVLPRNETEERLAKLWRGVLGCAKLGVTEDFFQLGGDSLKVTLLSARMQREWGVGVAVGELFRLPTIEKLARHLDGAASRKVSAIPHVADAPSYAPSAAQERLFVLEGMEGIGAAYVLPAEFVIEGPLDRERLSFTFDRLVERHEALRTTLELLDGRLVQRVHPVVKYKKPFREVPESGVAEQLAELGRPFDLGQAPLFRLGLFWLGPNRHLLALSLHHIISDGITLQVLLEEWFALYAGQELPPVRLPYRDYAAWHRARLDSGALESQEAFWRAQLAAPLAVLEMPLDRTRQAAKTYAGRTVSGTVPAELADALRELSGASSATLYMVLLSAYAALLARYSGQEEVLIGTPFGGRSHPDLERAIGMFVNTLPVRAYPRASKTFRELVAEVRDLALASAENQDYPFDRMVERLGIRRDPRRNPIFDVMFSYLAEEPPQMPGLVVRRFARARGTAHFDLTLEVVHEGAGKPLSLEWEFATALFDADTIERLSGHFIELLRQVVEDPDVPLGAIEVLPAAERARILEGFNDTALAVDRAATASRAFSTAARRHPAKPALVFRERAWTFAQVDALVDRLAGRLQLLGLERDGIAAVLVERSADLVIAALAAMRAGGAYLPIDAAYPQGRVEYMLADSGATLLLTHHKLDARGASWQGPRVFLDDPIPAGTPAPDATRPEDLAYIIYTSGSTGKPKGVMIEHRNLMNLCAWVTSYHGVTADDVAATYSGFGFDASVWEIFPFLLAGCTLHVVPDELRLSPVELNQSFDRHGVTITNLPTQLAEQFMELAVSRSLRTLVTGGDKLKSFRPKSYRLVNEYGPTEYTVSATAFTVDRAQDNIPIGKPLANTWAYILDGRDRVQPVGVAGELCIAGAQMARGYLNRPELTSEKFIANPFATCDDNRRMYRTGDLARWRPDGNIEFLGRVDFQVKIRGYRIELGEIEHQLLRCPGVADACVIDRKDASGSSYLCGYVVAPEFDEVELKKLLGAELPDYMVPAHLIALAKIPLNANGKIDRPRLPGPAAKDAEEFVEPSTPEEKTIAQVWCQVLGVARAGAGDNFFDLGGTSIKAISVVARLRQRYTVTINDVFAHQTLAELARSLRPVADGLKARLLRLKDELAAAPPDGLDEHATDRAAYAAANARYASMDLSEVTPWGTVLLTGATGYLGAYLLRALLDGPADRVYALVRAPSDEEARSRVLAKAAYYFGAEHRGRLATDPRLIVWPADLGRERLGLDSARHVTLAGEVDQIVHAAANVKHFGHYQDFHEANVQSVIGLCELARTDRAKVLHHVSTVSVGEGDVPGRSALLFTEDHADIGQVHDNHYLRSKTEGERVVHEARAAGLAANIYRVGNIVWDSRSGCCQENLGENAFFQRVKSFLDVGAVPDDARVSEEFSNVDLVARALIELGGRRALTGGTYHLYNPAWRRTAAMLGEPALGLRVRFLSFPRFVDFLAGHVDKPAFRHAIETVLTHLDLLEESRDRTAVEVPADRTVSLLERLGFSWPVPDAKRMGPMVERALDDRVALLRTGSPFAAAPDSALRGLARVGLLALYAGERHVTWEGEPNDEVHLIIEGLAALSRTAPGGWTGTVCVVKPRDFIGLESALGATKAQVIAEPAMGDLVVLSIPAAAVRALLLEQPQVAVDLLRELQKACDRLQRLVVSMG